MNVICLMNDTLRADHINAYGLAAPWERPGHPHEPFMHTPHLDQLAAESAVFDRCYIGSYPTIPCRHDIYTGQIGFPTLGWEPLHPDEAILPEWLAAAGYTTMLIFDTPPLANDEYNFTRGFSAWDWIRGQHRDRWITDPLDVQVPSARFKTKSPTGLRLYLLNATRRRYDRDWMCLKTAHAVSDWLERNAARDRFFLWVDMWDPHDPFDAPAHDLHRYVDPAYTGDPVIYPKYGRVDYLTPAELNDVRARYAAKVQTVDRAVGLIMDTLKTVGLDQNTLVIHTTDHGHLFGEHGLQGKPTGPLGKLYEPTTRIPLMIRHPTGMGQGQRISALVQPPDLTATILDAAQVPIPSSVAGQSLLPLMQHGGSGRHRFTFSGRFSRQVNILGMGATTSREGAATFDGWVGMDSTSEPLTVTTDEWALVVPPAGGGAPELYHLPSDPAQLVEVGADHPQEVDRLHRALLDFLSTHGAPNERVRAYQRDLAAPSPYALSASLTIYTVPIAGRLYGFLAHEEALANRLGDVAVTETTLGALRARDAQAMVCIGDQYYWAQDIQVER